MFCRSSYFHIQALRHIRQALTDDMAKTVAASLIHTHVDYADSLIHGSTIVKKLQRVPTSVAHVVLPAFHNNWPLLFSLNYTGYSLTLE